MKKIGSMYGLRKVLVCLLIGFVGVGSLIAQNEIVFKANADKEKVALNGRFKIKFTINAKGSNFQPPSFENFKVLAGPNQSTQMRIVNGEVSRKIAYSFILSPRKKGNFTIKPARIKVNGNTLTSNSVDIEVVDAKQKSQQQARGQQGQSSKADIKQKIQDNLFIRTTVSKQDVYKGEAFVATYRLYTRVSIVKYNVEEMPSFSGFWTHDVESPKKPNFENTTYNGKQYKSAVIKKVLLFPQKAGELEVDPLKMETTVRVKAQKKQKKKRSLLDAFFKDRYRNIKQVIASNPVTLNVQPLPEKQRPKSFNGAVGDFDFQASLENRQTKVNEPVKLRVKLQGQGNLKLVDPPSFELSPDLEVYDPDVKDNINVNASGMRGTRTYEYLMIPRYNGEYKIPSLDFSYFDPQDEKYHTISTDSMILAVQGKVSSATGESGNRKKAVKQLGEDILFIETGAVRFRQQGEHFFGSVPFFLLLGFPIAVLFGMVLYKKRKEQSLQDTPAMRRKRAPKLARSRLNTAYTHWQEGETDKFYDELLKAIWGYLADTMNMPQSELTQDQVKHTLQEENVNEDVIENLMNTWEEAEFARYASGGEEGAAEQHYEQTQQFINDLEEQLQ